MTNKIKLKPLVFSLGLAAMTLTANNLNAQSRQGGLFGSNFPSESSEGGFMRSGGDPITIYEGGDSFTNGNFGEEAPLGSGIAIMLAAGLGYVALKKKED